MPGLCVGLSHEGVAVDEVDGEAKGEVSVARPDLKQEGEAHARQKARARLEDEAKDASERLGPSPDPTQAGQELKRSA